MTNLVVFSDLDGTLLDHDSYSFEAAKSALDLLATRAIPLILATSKTAAEVAKLHTELGLGNWPAIVENGAGLYRPNAAEAMDNEYPELRAALSMLPQELRVLFEGFGDMPEARISALTGLDHEAASRARQRRFSEPGLWHGDNNEQARFVTALSKMGIAARSGGRFLTLSKGKTKADGMRRIADELSASKTIALGDAPNDVEMLELADIGVIVRNDHGPGIPTLAGETTGTIRRSQQPGPQGWNESVSAILNELKD